MRAMKLQKDKARRLGGFGQAFSTPVRHQGKTGAWHLGYDTETAEGQVLAVLKDGAEVN